MEYYKILGVRSTSTQKEIKDAYRALAKKYHPDTYKGNKESAESKMKEINEAYDTLSDKEKRMAYDNINNPQENIYNNFDSNFYASNTNKNEASRTYYNYGPYTEEESYYQRHSTNYNVDFSSIKNKLRVKLKYIMLSVVLILVISIIGIVLIVKLLIGMFTNITEMISPSFDMLKPKYHDKKTTSGEDAKGEDAYKSAEEWQKDIQDAMNKSKESSQEWYNAEGKEYEKQIKELLLDLEKQIKEELGKENN